VQHPCSGKVPGFRRDLAPKTERLNHEDIAALDEASFMGSNEQVCTAFKVAGFNMEQGPDCLVQLCVGAFGNDVIDVELQAQIEEALEDQQAGTIEPYAFPDRLRPAQLTLDLAGDFGLDEFIADNNDRLVDGNEAAVIPDALAPSLPADPNS
jgi:hypothetical protein